MMCRDLFVLSALSFGTLFVVGCGEKTGPVSSDSVPATTANAMPSKEAEYAKAIGELPEEDRADAIAQKFCAVSAKSRLGSMGMPFKVMIDGKPVFLCCEGCKDEAVKDGDATLAKVEELKAAAK